MDQGGALKIEPVKHLYCHHCHRPRDGMVVQCKAGSCRLKYCKRCLESHYGENSIEALAILDWKCPRCRNSCDCSRCRISRGKKPLGRAKKGTLTIEQQGDASEDAMKIHVNESEASASTSIAGKESTPVYVNEVPTMPQGSPIDSVASIAMPASDIGYAFQFLEFCKVFGQVFDLNQDDPKKLLYSLFFYERQKDNQSLIVQFQERLISFLPKDGRRKSPSTWIESLNRFKSISKCPILTPQSDISSITENEYDQLDPSSKLRIVNFLCDELLNSEKVRAMIKNAELSLENKPLINSSSKVAVSTDEMALDMPHLETDAEVTTEEETHVNVIRLEPLCSTDSGGKFWNFESTPNDHSTVYFQDFGEKSNNAFDSPHERWIKFDPEQTDLVQVYISSILKTKASNKSDHRRKQRRDP